MPTDQQAHSEFDAYAPSYTELLDDSAGNRFAQDPTHFHHRKWLLIQRLLSRAGDHGLPAVPYGTLCVLKKATKATMNRNGSCWQETQRLSGHPMFDTGSSVYLWRQISSTSITGGVVPGSVMAMEHSL